MQANVARDLRWADQFEEPIKAILGRHLIRVATRREDTQEATDLCFDIMGGTIGCRVRRPDVLRGKFASRYAFEWTLRETRPTGAPCEVAKIIETGKPDFYVYAHAGDDLGELRRWILVRMSAFRAQWMTFGVCGFGVERAAYSKHPRAIRGQGNIPNRDGSSTLAAVDLRSLDLDCFVATSADFWTWADEAA